MARSKIRHALMKLNNGYAQDRKRKYFYWKHGLNTRQTDYRNMTEQQFIDWACGGDRNLFNQLKEWENTEQYKRFEYIYKSEQLDGDLLEVYEAVKEEAKRGNSSAVKAFLDLQKIIKNKAKQFDKEKDKQENEDDGLTLEV